MQAPFIMQGKAGDRHGTETRCGAYCGSGDSQ